MIHINRRVILAASAVALSMPSWSQTSEKYPSRPIRMVVAFAAGGPGDILTRLVAHQMTEVLGQNVIVENKPGANGETGTVHVAQSPADGYTVLQVSTVQTINMALRDNIRYNLNRDFEPVAHAFEAPLVLVSPGTAPYKNVQGLLTYAKSKPEGIVYGSGGTGTVGHLSSELFRRSAGFQAIHAPYPGTGAAMNDLAGGRLDYFFSTIADSIGHIKSGRLKALAVTSTGRDPVLPGVPAMSEIGYRDINPLVSWGFMVPKGTPPAVVKVLQEAIAKSVNSPNVQKKLISMSVTPNFGGPEVLASSITRDFNIWSQVIKTANIQPN